MLRLGGAGPRTARRSGTGGMPCGTSLESRSWEESQPGQPPMPGSICPRRRDKWTECRRSCFVDIQRIQRNVLHFPPLDFLIAFQKKKKKKFSLFTKISCGHWRGFLTQCTWRCGIVCLSNAMLQTQRRQTARCQKAGFEILQQLQMSHAAASSSDGAHSL